MKKTFLAIGGLDLHKLKDLVPLYQVVSADSFTQNDILDSLKRGEFVTIKGFIEFPPLGDPAITMTGFIYLFAFVQFVPNISKKIIRKIFKKWQSTM